MEWILIGATLLGGLAAVAYFWGKLSDRFRREPAKDERRERRRPEEKWVDLKYPSDSGLKQQLEAEGFRVAWCMEDKLARRLDLEGWELVTQELEGGSQVILKVQDWPYNQTLIKKLESKPADTSG